MARKARCWAQPTELVTAPGLRRPAPWLRRTLRVRAAPAQRATAYGAPWLRSWPGVRAHPSGRDTRPARAQRARQRASESEPRRDSSRGRIGQFWAMVRRDADGRGDIPAHEEAGGSTVERLRLSADRSRPRRV